MKSRKTIILLLCGAILAGCKFKGTEQNGYHKKALYFDYQINGADDKEDVSCILKYRQDGPGGLATMIDSPGAVSIDGKQIQASVATKAGVYYEITPAKNEFVGFHRIELKDQNARKYSEDVEFRPFTLLEELPQSLRRKPFIIRLDKFPLDGRLRLVMADTSVAGVAINEIVKVTDGKVGVSQFMMDRLRAGPILMKLYLEQERPLKNTMQAGGLLTIYYTLERDFNLLDK